jgi:hypothetical protein
MNDRYYRSACAPGPSQNRIPPCDTEVFEVQRHAFRIALQPASLLFLDERDRVTLVNVESVWVERSNRVGKLRGKTLTPTAEALILRSAD